MSHDHHHPEPTDPAIRVEAIEQLLVKRGLVTEERIEELINHYETEVGPTNGQWSWSAPCAPATRGRCSVCRPLGTSRRSIGPVLSGSLRPFLLSSEPNRPTRPRSECEIPPLNFAISCCLRGPIPRLVRPSRSWLHWSDATP